MPNWQSPFSSRMAMKSTKNIRVTHTAGNTRSYQPPYVGMRLRDYVPQVEDDEFDWVGYTHPDAMLDRSFDEFAALVMRGVDRSSPESVTAVRVLMGELRAHSLPDRLLLSNRRVRRRGYDELYELLRENFVGPAGTQRRWISGTIVDDQANALEYHTTLDLERHRNKARKVMAALQLHSLAFLEIQIGEFPRGGDGRTLMPHTHFIGYTDDPAYDSRQRLRRILKKPSLTNWLGMPTVKLKPILNLSHLRRFCGYLFKAPVLEKRLVPDDRKATGFRLEKAAIDPPLALRLSEVLSQIDYRQACFATGDGLTLKSAWLACLSGWHRRRVGKRDIDAQAVWARIWAEPRWQRRRHPIDLRFTTEGLPSSSWESAMQDIVAVVANNRERHRAIHSSRRALNLVELL